MANELFSTGSTSETRYAIVKDVVTGYVWNGYQFVQWSSVASRADVAIDTPELTTSTDEGTGEYAADMPAGVTGIRELLVLHYSQQGDDPSADDALVYEQQDNWDGSAWVPEGTAAEAPASPGNYFSNYFGNYFGARAAAGTAFWTSRGAVERRYGVMNTGTDADLDNDGTGIIAVWAETLADVDVLIDRKIGEYGYSRPTVYTGTDYKAVSQVARDIVRVELYKSRGWGDTSGVANQSIAGKFAQLEKDAWDRLDRMLAKKLDFPREANDSATFDLPMSIAPERDPLGFPVSTSKTPNRFAYPYGYGYGYNGW